MVVFLPPTKYEKFTYFCDCVCLLICSFRLSFWLLLSRWILSVFMNFLLLLLTTESEYQSNILFIEDFSTIFILKSNVPDVFVTIPFDLWLLLTSRELNRSFPIYALLCSDGVAFDTHDFNDTFSVFSASDF